MEKCFFLTFRYFGCWLASGNFLGARVPIFVTLIPGISFPAHKNPKLNTHQGGVDIESELILVSFFIIIL